MAKNGRLYLIPTVIAEGTQHRVIPRYVKDALKTIRYFLVENVRTARRFLSSLRIYESIQALQFSVLDKQTTEAALPPLFEPVINGYDLGVLSESGCPGIADPGAMAVRYAHRHNVQVIPLVGPSSIILALMASGLNGQRFAFHGYLPVDRRESARAIKEFERESAVKGQTQIFIETPYRNSDLLGKLLATLRSDTELCVSLDMTGNAETILSMPVGKWRSGHVTLPKQPAIFMFLSVPGPKR